MNPLEAVFRIANFGAVVAWIVLVLAAAFGWRRALQRFCGSLVPLLLASAYVVLLVTHWGGPGDVSSLAGVGLLFRQPAALLAGWLHYLAFDLLVGVMIAQRFLDDRLPRILLLPVLPLAFFFAPAGWLLFEAIRFARRDAAPASAPAAAGRARKAPRPRPNITEPT